jgi:hypothetical protein
MAERLAGYQYFLAGAGVGAIATFLSTPFEMVKVQLQLDNVSLKQYTLPLPLPVVLWPRRLVAASL